MRKSAALLAALMLAVGLGTSGCTAGRDAQQPTSSSSATSEHGDLPSVRHTAQRTLAAN